MPCGESKTEMKAEAVRAVAIARSIEFGRPSRSGVSEFFDPLMLCQGWHANVRLRGCRIWYKKSSSLPWKAGIAISVAGIISPSGQIYVEIYMYPF
jgi:hypothetical protein